jgi:ELWxxDGT repeat protein
MFKKRLFLILLISAIHLVTQAQTLVQDIEPGVLSSSPFLYGSVNNGVIFYAYSGDYGKEPWFSDGTQQGTFMLADIQAGTASSDFPSYFIKLGNTYYFIAKHQGSFTISLWKTDGTKSGTSMVKDLGGIVIPPGGGNLNALPMVAFNNAIYFIHEDSRGSEIWKSDGTSAGTNILKDIRAGSNSASPNGLCVFNNYLYFYANDGINGNELWRTDGSANGTALFKDIYPSSISSFSGPSASLFVFKNHLYFGAQGTHDEGVELYRTDGTTSGTALFIDINTTQQASSFPGYLDQTDAYFIFRASNSTLGTETWRSDGTANGTFVLKDINPGTGNTFAYSTTRLGNKITFATYSAQEGAEIWITDGTTANTNILRVLNPGSADSYVGPSINAGNHLYFIGQSSDEGQEIWESDGTTAGTKLFKDINTGTASSGIRSFQAVNNKLFFNATNDVESVGNELYVLSIINYTNISELDMNLGVYPNPIKAGGIYNLEGLKDRQYTAILYNQIGAAVVNYSGAEKQFEIPLDLSAGVYQLLVQQDDKTFCVKLLIQNQ